MRRAKCPCGGDLLIALQTRVSAELIMNVNHYTEWVKELGNHGQEDQYLWPSQLKPETFPILLPTHATMDTEWEIYCTDCGLEVEIEEVIFE